jgi:hypothetical protein
MCTGVQAKLQSDDFGNGKQCAFRNSPDNAVRHYAAALISFTPLYRVILSQTLD